VGIFLLFRRSLDWFIQIVTGNIFFVFASINIRKDFDFPLSWFATWVVNQSRIVIQRQTYNCKKEMWLKHAICRSLSFRGNNIPFSCCSLSVSTYQHQTKTIQESDMIITISDLTVIYVQNISVPSCMSFHIPNIFREFQRSEWNQCGFEPWSGSLHKPPVYS